MLPLCNREALVHDLRNVPGTQFAQIIEVRIISNIFTYLHTLLGDEIIAHLKKGRNGCFAKTVFNFLRADEKGSCTAIIKGKTANLGDGEGMQVPCTLHFKGATKFIDLLR